MDSPGPQSNSRNAFLAVLVTAVVIAAFLIGRATNSTPASSPPATAPSTSPLRPLTTNAAEPYYAGHPGDWGELAFAHINIEPPDDFITVDDRTFAPTQWYFGNHNRAAVEKLLADCPLTPAQRDVLAAPTIWSTTSNTVVLTPPPQLILGLDSVSRTKLYIVLAEDPRNDFQYWPYTYRDGGFDDWFRDSGVSPVTAELVRRLTYQRGASLCFSDLPEVFAQLPDQLEKRRLLKTLARNATLLIKLRVQPNRDVTSLVDYWGRGRRTKDLKPLLESLTRVPGGLTLDASHLLPPFARKRLYTYPLPNAQPRPDCYWSAFNFFNDTPDDRFAIPAEWQAEADKNYVPVPKPVFGDIILLLGQDNLPIHAANYIADDIVFTKNGGSERQPWIFMRWDDLLAHYPENFNVRVLFLHPKTPVTRRHDATQG